MVHMLYKYRTNYQSLSRCTKLSVFLWLICYVNAGQIIRVSVGVRNKKTGVAETPELYIANIKMLKNCTGLYHHIAWTGTEHSRRLNMLICSQYSYTLVDETCLSAANTRTL